MVKTILRQGWIWKDRLEETNPDDPEIIYRDYAEQEAEAYRKAFSEKDADRHEENGFHDIQDAIISGGELTEEEQLELMMDLLGL